MTEIQNENQQEQKQTDKEMNFRAVEAKHRREMQEMQSRLQEAERKAQEASTRHDEEDDEPYVAPKKLDRRLAQFGQSTQSDITKAMETAKQAAKYEIKQEMWLERNPDFYDTLKHANKLYEKDPELAETILEMPEGFERQKLVYKNIKALELDKPKKQEPSIQEKIDANRRSPYYQPSGVATAPYAMAGDYSDAGQKNAYDKMQELKKRLRI